METVSALILLLGLSPWSGTIFLLLEQIATSPVAHVRTCCEDFCVCRKGEMTPEIPEIFDAFGPHWAHNSIGSCLLEFYFSIFVVSCSGLRHFKASHHRRQGKKSLSKFVDNWNNDSGLKVHALHYANELLKNRNNKKLSKTGFGYD